MLRYGRYCGLLQMSFCEIVCLIYIEPFVQTHHNRYVFLCFCLCVFLWFCLDPAAVVECGAMD